MKHHNHAGLVSDQKYTGLESHKTAKTKDERN